MKKLSCWFCTVDPVFFKTTDSPFFNEPTLSFFPDSHFICWLASVKENNLNQKLLRSNGTYAKEPADKVLTSVLLLNLQRNVLSKTSSITTCASLYTCAGNYAGSVKLCHLWFDSWQAHCNGLDLIKRWQTFSFYYISFFFLIDLFLQFFNTQQILQQLSYSSDQYSLIILKQSPSY